MIAYSNGIESLITVSYHFVVIVIVGIVVFFGSSELFFVLILAPYCQAHVEGRPLAKGERAK